MLIGFDTSAGSAGSISRTFVFFPFFVLGYYSSKNKFVENKNFKFYKYINLILVLIICFLLFVYRNSINVEWMYGYSSYANLNYNSIIRFILYLIGFVWIFFFRSFIPKKKMFFSKIGRNSITVYLFHYFIVYLLVKYKLLYSGNHLTINCIFYAVLITVLLSSDKLVKIFKKK